MGACEFWNTSERKAGKTARDAFSEVVDHARWESGHGGYSGTIAEKNSFEIVGKVATQQEAQALSEELFNDNESVANDKWGPAACIEITEGPVQFLFFGLASS